MYRSGHSVQLDSASLSKVWYGVAIGVGAATLAIIDDGIFGVASGGVGAEGTAGRQDGRTAGI